MLGPMIRPRVIRTNSCFIGARKGKRKACEAQTKARKGKGKQETTKTRRIITGYHYQHFTYRKTIYRVHAACIKLNGITIKENRNERKQTHHCAHHYLTEKTSFRAVNWRSISQQDGLFLNPIQSCAPKAIFYRLRLLYSPVLARLMSRPCCCCCCSG